MLLLKEKCATFSTFSGIFMTGRPEGGACMVLIFLYILRLAVFIEVVLINKSM